MFYRKRKIKMLYPEIMIFATGGSHGDFLLQSCEIMTNARNINTKISNEGRSYWESSFKKNMIKSFYKGKKKFIEAEIDNINKIELSHVYYNEFKEWPTKFFYIDFPKECLDSVLNFYILKIHNNNIDEVLLDIKKTIGDGISRKINKENYREIMKILWWNAKEKYKKLKDIEKIDMLSFYKFENMCKNLKKLKVYNKQYLKIYKEFYQRWYENNKELIKNIVKT